MLKLFPLIALLLFAAPAEAHNKHRHRTRTQVVIAPWGFSYWYAPRQPRIRLSENCVYKPWKDRTVCRY